MLKLIAYFTSYSLLTSNHQVMRTRILAITILSCLIPFLLIDNSSAQENYRKHSLSLNVGTVNSTGSNTSGNWISPFGYYGASVDFGLSLGGSYMYAVSPELSIEARTQIQRFNRRTLGIQTIANTSLRGVVFFNQLFDFNFFSPKLAPYATLGGGLDFIELDDIFNDVGWNVVGGIGLNIYVSEGLDFFTQYDLTGGNAANPERVGGDPIATYGTAYAGVRYHFGSPGDKHKSWRGPTRDLFDEDYESIMAMQPRLDELDREATLNNEEIQRLSRELNSAVRQLEQRDQMLADEIESLSSEISDLKTSIEDGTITPGNDGASIIDDSGTMIETDGPMNGLPNGHYVQVFASRNLSSAQSARDITLDMLDDSMSNASDMVFIAERQGFYEVFVGMFNRFPAAANAQGVAQNHFNDAFVITFPRPAEMMDLYEGMTAPVEE